MSDTFTVSTGATVKHSITPNFRPDARIGQELRVRLVGGVEVQATVTRVFYLRRGYGGDYTYMVQTDGGMNFFAVYAADGGWDELGCNKGGVAISDQEASSHVYMLKSRAYRSFWRMYLRDLLDWLIVRI